MKRAFLVILSVGALAVACSTLNTSADYDPSTDFSRYKTWDLHSDGSIENPLLARRIETAVSAEFAKKGITRNQSNPDLWVAVHGRMSTQTQIHTYDSGWGYGWRWGGGMSTSTVTEVPVGTLIVDLVDANRKELVWRGTASDTLDPKASPEKKEKNLQEAMAKLLSGYPPAKKGA